MYASRARAFACARNRKVDNLNRNTARVSSGEEAGRILRHQGQGRNSSGNHLLKAYGGFAAGVPTKAEGAADRGEAVVAGHGSGHQHHPAWSAVSMYRWGLTLMIHQFM